MNIILALKWASSSEANWWSTSINASAAQLFNTIFDLLVKLMAEQLMQNLSLECTYETVCGHFSIVMIEIVCI